MFRRTGKPDEISFETQLFDAQDRLITCLRGKGVIFRNRNFEKWREGSKSKASTVRKEPSGFTYATWAQLGLSEAEPPLLSPLTEDQGALSTTALITKDNGLVPGHPFFTGSGDHVNAPHLAEVGRQCVSLINDGAPLIIAHAEMDMHRYIELGTPIAVTIERRDEQRANLAISQLGRSCATITMSWAFL